MKLFENSKVITGSSISSTLLILVSSACCAGPLVLIFSFIGISSSTLLSIENVVGPYRLIILIITGASLILGFYFAYKPQKESCEPEKVCAQPQSRKKQRIGLWIATGFLLVLLYFTYVHPNLDILFGIYL